MPICEGRAFRAKTIAAGQHGGSAAWRHLWAGLGPYAPLLLSVLLTGSAWHAVRRGMFGSGPAMANALCELGIAVGLLLVGSLPARPGSVLASLPRARLRRLWPTWRRHRWLLLGAAVLGAGGNLIAYSVIRSEGAAVAALLNNFVPAWLVIAGLTRGEKVGRGELFALVALLVGAVAFTWHGAFPRWIPLVLMVVACAGTAGKHMAFAHLGRRGRLAPAVVILALLMSVMSFAVAALRGEHFPNALGFTCLLGAAWMGGCIGTMLFLRSYATLGVARAAPFDTLRGPVALGIGVGLGTAVVGIPQMIGMTVMIIAVITLVRRRHRP